MKYWRGFLVAGILSACTWGLLAFAKAHSALVDMFYPYLSRLISTGAASWSSSVDFCLWQVFLIAVVLIAVTLIALAVALRWNVLQITGWITAIASFVILLNTGIFGMNQYAGPLADDIHLNMTKYDVVELEEAAAYYLDLALQAQGELVIGEDGIIEGSKFETVAEIAPVGYTHLIYNKSYSVFAGSKVPVKKLGWNGYYTDKGVTGVTIMLTGEAAVNPDVPAVLLPVAVCREMAHRMSIYSHRDATFAAILACQNNSAAIFRYSAYLNAYRYCSYALQSLASDEALTALTRLDELSGGKLDGDIQVIDSFLKDSETEEDAGGVVDMLVSWYIQEIYLPAHTDDVNAPKFDPLDEEQVDLSGIVNAK